MRSLLVMELYKLWRNKRFLLLLGILLLCNIGFLSYETWGQGEVPVQAYRKLSAQLHTMDPTQRYTFIQKHQAQVELAEVKALLVQLRKQHTPEAEIRIEALQEQYPDSRKGSENPFLYTGALEAETAFMESVKTQADIVKEYPAFLNEIQQKAATISSISIFSEQDGFSSRNIQKSSADYAAMKSVQIDFQLEDGLLRAVSSPVTAMLVLLSILLYSTMVLMQEKEQKLLPMVYGTVRGASSLLHAKTAAIILSSLVIPVLFYGGNLLLMGIAYGPVKGAASIQSLASFQQSSLPLSIWELLLLFLLLKICICVIAAQAMQAFCLLFQHKITCYVCILGCVILAMLMHNFISPVGTFRVLHYINPVQLFQVIPLLQTYVNFNFFQHPVSLLPVYLGTLLLLLIALYAVLHILVNRPLRVRSFPQPLQGLRFLHLPVSRKLWLQECYKFFWVQKIWIICLVFAGLQLYSYSHTQQYTSTHERLWISYLQKLQGPLTADKEAFLQKEKKYYEGLHEQEAQLLQRLHEKDISMEQYRRLMEPISNVLQKEEAFQEVLQEYAYIKQDPSRQFVIPFGYRRQFFSPDVWILPIALLLFLISISNLHTIEYRNQRHILLQASVHGGRSMAHRKHLLALLCGMLLLATALLPQLLRNMEMYGLPCGDASITSLREFAHLPAWISLSMFMAGSALIKVSALLPVILLSHAIAVKGQRQLITLLLSVLLFLVPLIISAAGIHLLDGVSLYPLLYNEGCMTSVSGMWNLLFSILGYGALSAICYRIASR